MNAVAAHNHYCNNAAISNYQQMVYGAEEACHVAVEM